MNLDERAACDGLDNASICETVAWIKDQCERLEWEIYASTNALTEQRSNLARLENRED